MQQVIEDLVVCCQFVGRSVSTSAERSPKGPSPWVGFQHEQVKVDRFKRQMLGEPQTCLHLAAIVVEGVLPRRLWISSLKVKIDLLKMSISTKKTLPKKHRVSFSGPYGRSIADVIYQATVACDTGERHTREAGVSPTSDSMSKDTIKMFRRFDAVRLIVRRL